MSNDLRDLDRNELAVLVNALSLLRDDLDEDDEDLPTIERLLDKLAVI